MTQLNPFETTNFLQQPYGTNNAHTTPMFADNITPVGGTLPLYTSPIAEAPKVAPTNIQTKPVVTGSVASINTGAKPVVATTPTTVATPIVNPVPGSVAAVQAGMYQSGLTPEQQALQAQLLVDQQATATQVLSPEQEYQNQLKNYQAQIDSINAMYADRINQARIQGQGRIESRQFAQGRSGQIGSGVGEAGVNAVQDANTQVENSIRAEQSAAIQDVYARVRKGADESLAAKTLAKQAGADKLLEYLNNVPGEKKKATSGAVAELLARGVDITNMTPEEIKSYTSGLGISEEQLSSEFKAQAKILKDEQAKKEQAQAKADADLAKTKADTEKILSDTANWGKLTEYQKGQLQQQGIKNKQDYELAKDKATSDIAKTKSEVDVLVNTNIAGAQADGQWDNWSKDERERFIRSLGGLPSEYEI
jgi:hypothetical protein